MKKIICLFYIAASIGTLGSQNLSTVMRFPFDSGFFALTESWDANEGKQGGPQSIRFLTAKDLAVYSAMASELRYYTLGDTSIKHSLELPELPTRPRRFWKYVVFGSPQANLSLLFHEKAMGVHFPDFVLRMQRNYPRSDAPISDIPYYTESRLFAATSSRRLVSWELLGTDRYRFLGVDETARWLSENGERIGYRFENNLYHVFGDSNIQSSYGTIAWRIERELQPLEPYRQRHAEVGNFWNFIGTDSQGLSYYRVEEWDQNLPDGRNHYLLFRIVDPWTKRVVLRSTIPGQWTVIDGPQGRVSAFPTAVNPNGDLYMIDASREERAYRLKRMANNWWAELGASNRRIGQVTRNQVPLQGTPENPAVFDGYNYENDYVWVLEERAIRGTGPASEIWFHVRKLDGREGWIPASVVFFELLE